MSSMIDMVGAAILFGVLILSVARVQGNLNTTLAQNTFNITTQTTAMGLARTIEYEISKAGYNVTGLRVTYADSTKITFRGGMAYGAAPDSITYEIGGQDSTTMNPNDYRFIRTVHSSTPISQRLGMTEFKITYYDTSGVKMATPVTGTNRLAIRGINIRFRVESAEPVTDASTGLSNYNAVTWEKLTFPRNLGRPF